MRTRAETPTILMIGGRQVAVDDQGFLINPDDWNEQVAEELARKVNVTLTAQHWEVIRFMRNYLAEHSVAADARFVFRFLNSRLGADGNAGRALFFELFPYGHVAQACRIAGMRQPRGWSTG